ncbi:hypothetical protein J1614_007572 [Plenodomus biglobosus]|nr:hypothetical protein J1614_007572 [Plenodomus biglobosus]
MNATGLFPRSPQQQCWVAAPTKAMRSKEQKRNYRAMVSTHLEGQGITDEEDIDIMNRETWASMRKKSSLAISMNPNGWYFWGQPNYGILSFVRALSEPALPNDRMSLERARLRRQSYPRLSHWPVTIAMVLSARLLDALSVRDWMLCESSYKAHT